MDLIALTPPFFEIFREQYPAPFLYQKVGECLQILQKARAQPLPGPYQPLGLDAFWEQLKAECPNEITRIEELERIAKAVWPLAALDTKALLHLLDEGVVPLKALYEEMKQYPWGPEEALLTHNEAALEKWEHHIYNGLYCRSLAATRLQASREVEDIVYVLWQECEEIRGGQKSASPLPSSLNRSLNDDRRLLVYQTLKAARYSQAYLDKLLTLLPKKRLQARPVFPLAQQDKLAEERQKMRETLAVSSNSLPAFGKGLLAWWHQFKHLFGIAALLTVSFFAEKVFSLRSICALWGLNHYLKSYLWEGKKRTLREALWVWERSAKWTENKLYQPILDLFSFDSEEIERQMTENLLAIEKVLQKLDHVSWLEKLWPDTFGLKESSLRLKEVLRAQQEVIRQGARCLAQQISAESADAMLVLIKTIEKDQLIPALTPTCYESLKRWVEGYGDYALQKQFQQNTDAMALWITRLAHCRVLRKAVDPHSVPWGGSALRYDALRGWHVLLNTFVIDPVKRESCLALNAWLMGESQALTGESPAKTPWEWVRFLALGEKEEAAIQKIQEMVFYCLPEYPAEYAYHTSEKHKELIKKWHEEYEGPVSEAAQAIERSFLEDPAMLSLEHSTQLPSVYGLLAGEDIYYASLGEAPDHRRQLARDYFSRYQGETPVSDLLLRLLPSEDQAKGVVQAAIKRLHVLFEQLPSFLNPTEALDPLDIKLFQKASVIKQGGFEEEWKRCVERASPLERWENYYRLFFERACSNLAVEDGTREAYYRRITETVKRALRDLPEDAVWLLSSFFEEWAQTSHPSDALFATYQWLETQLSIEEKKKIWQALSDLTPEQLMPWERITIRFFKESLLQSVAFVSAASLEDLLRVGHDPDYYRLTLIALVRKHLREHQLSDPFSEGFSYALLQSAGVEQNTTYVSSYLARCASLPIDWIVQLSINEDMAFLLYLECMGTPFIFEVGKKFAERYAQMRSNIAQNWHTWMATYSMTRAQKAFLDRELPGLRKRYPEFKRIPEKVVLIERRYSSPITTPANHTWGWNWGSAVALTGGGVFLAVIPCTRAMFVTALFTAVETGIAVGCSPFAASILLPTTAAGLYYYWRTGGQSSSLQTGQQPAVAFGGERLTG